jgi:hypothetical protein
MTNAYKNLVGKPEEKRQLGRPRRKWEDYIKMDRKETGCGLDSSGSEYGPVAGSCEHGNEPAVSISGEFID